MPGSGLPESFRTVDELEEYMTRPWENLPAALAGCAGDFLILGVGGKMGPSLARTLSRAPSAAGVSRRIFGVDKQFLPDVERALRAAGVETVRCDVLEDGALDRLPDAANVVYMIGVKFGSTGNEPFTWAMNAYVPGIVARRFRGSRMVAFSSGNVYPFVPVDSSGATEETPPGPVGEYAQSCLGRERIVQFFSTRCGNPSVIVRLNYAIDLRYGVLLDIAEKVRDGVPIDLRMGYANVIWQGDANNYILHAFSLASVPARILNVAGAEKFRVREVACRFGELLGKEPRFVGEEAPNALLNDARQSYRLFGEPRVSLDAMVRWVAAWVNAGGPTLGKPTHFEEREGKF